MYTDSYIAAYIAEHRAQLLTLSQNICRNLKKGNTLVSYDKLNEAWILIDLLENYASCLTEAKRDSLFGRLNDILAQCNIVTIIMPAATTDDCDEDNIITEDLYCIITEDEGINVVREDIPNIV